MIKGIGENTKQFGRVVIQVPFKYLDVVIYVPFFVVKKDIPTVQSMKDMVEKELDVSIKGQYVSLSERRHQIATKNYYLIHR